MTAATQDPYIGREVLGGKFKILQKIGSGGMGAVYKASQPDMNRMVAIKILHQKLTNRKDLVSRFRREARAMAHLTHPNTVRVVDYGELEDGALYIIMEYLEGRNLNQVVRKEGPLSVERALPVLIQACGALQEAHLQGIVHRDLKPENIFLSTNAGLKDYPKVLDFGLAKVTERELRPGSIMLTQEGMVFGTPEFMSPEQAQGKVLDARSDIYSLAVILYEVLTGKLPFEARTPMEHIQMHVNKAPIPIDERVPGKTFPAGLWGVLKKALEKKADDRYATAADFAEALKPFAGSAGKGFTAMMPTNNSAVLEQAAKQHAAALEAAKPAPQAGSPAFRPAPTVKMEVQPSPQMRPIAPPQRPTTSPVVLVAIAAGCLVAGIVLTIVAMKLFG
ncbi:serine/threonine protein kinase [Chondromyces crocatus]|uniref:Protein kinase n=1 Tax=Chondromyces crocatus TaxID=52 RepID=A0A0K1E8L8_CHOCO|nr:serine/threonine-protein kinase [Chondromyces crocatus]AKT37221.1 protein kinase [Chondromyces crocatus]